MSSGSISNKKARGYLGFLLRSLKYRNYRLYFSGQGISQVGSWIQTIAISWLVYSMTGSAFILGFVGFLSQVPVLFITPFAGVLVDRWNRHRTFIATQTMAMLQAFVLSALVLTGKIMLWHIILLSLFIGLVFSFELTVSQTFIVNIIEKREDLGNAIALNSALLNLARLLGPSLAGILIATAGEGVCFFINGASYLAVIAALLAMRIRPQPAARKRDLGKELKEGFLYVFGSLPLRSVILLQGFITLTGMPFQVLMPVFVKEILKEGPHALGFIVGSSGIGAIFATLFLAWRKDVLGLVRLIPLATGLLGLGLIASALSRLTLLSMFFAFFTGFGAIMQMAAGSTVLQRIVDDDKRGRVMSIYTIAFWGVYPLGNLLAGSLGNIIGVPNEYILSGVCCLAGSLVFAARQGSIAADVKQVLSPAGSEAKA
ncbi:MAG: MFS transporter [Peptococcaceae bacterium]|jgi:MFS family permease|nr:MFS transporter [Peptococcaceae bacterium]MDH7524368.1 MFS transporter [Peptococcaceae bacterium]